MIARLSTHEYALCSRDVCVDGRTRLCFLQYVGFMFYQCCLSLEWGLLDTAFSCCLCTWPQPSAGTIRDGFSCTKLAESLKLCLMTLVSWWVIINACYSVIVH